MLGRQDKEREIGIYQHDQAAVLSVGPWGIFRL